MIVSGFTRKCVKEEHYHGSALDHSHCVTCVNRSCRITGNDITSCDVTDCPRGCEGRYHSCKENEHVLLCPEERIVCINSTYGCPATIYRKNMAQHLSSCPASIVHCHSEWNRSHIQSTGEKPAVVQKKVHVDCGQLDTALALSDHRALVDTLLCPQKPSVRCPRAPVQPSALPAPELSSTSDLDLPGDLPDRWDFDFRQLKKKREMESMSQETSNQSIMSVSSSVSDHLPQVEPMNEETGKRLEEACPDRMDVPCDDEDLQVQPGQALGDILSVSLGVECIARGQPKSPSTYTFLCAQVMRRDEFPHHFSAVHDRIQSGISGWMEQRCPLAYLGCPFSFRRLRPSMPGITIHHSWLLESFGVSGVKPRGDLSHQTPAHLLPACAAAVDSGDISEECGGQSQAPPGVPLSQPSDPGERGAGTQRPAEEEQHAFPTSLSKSHLSQTTDACSAGLAHAQPAAPSFASLEDGIRGKMLRDENTGQVLFPEDTPLSHSAENSIHSVDMSGLMVQGSGQPESSGHRTPVQESGMSTVADRPSGAHNSQSFNCLLASCSAPVTERPVIYTALQADSCVRIDGTGTRDDSYGKRSEEAPPCLQLEDLPEEIVHHIMQFLDSFSLYSLSLVSRTMRHLCCALLQERGMVSLVWVKQWMRDKVIWRSIGKRWTFSTCFDPVESWSFTDHNPIPEHLQTCAFNQDRLRHKDKFSIIPLWTSEDG